ncbi:hypothetical protein PG997_000338 [Apiospora hydei]|uniref:Uncharacterized protein n=1 Tax=Apiospora hydei TaxID=1337664 RepID=A0ABR1XAE5_9PEZI
MSDPKGLKHARGDENDGSSTTPSSKRGKRNDGTYYYRACSSAPSGIPPKVEPRKNILQEILASEIVGKDTLDFLMGAKRESAQHLANDHTITQQSQRPGLYHTAPEVSTPGGNLLLNEQFLEADLQAVRDEYAELEAQLNELALLPQGQHQDTEAAIQNQIERLLNQRIVLHGTIKSSEQWLQDIRHSGGDPLELPTPNFQAAVDHLEIGFGHVTNALEKTLDDVDGDTVTKELGALRKMAFGLKTTAASLALAVDMAEATRDGRGIKRPIVDVEKASAYDVWQEDQEEDPWTPFWLYLKLLVFWAILGAVVCYAMPLLLCLVSFSFEKSAAV